MTYQRIPYLVAYQNDSGVRDVYGGLAEVVVLECHLLKPEQASDTVLVFMHPSAAGGGYLPMVTALARAGHHVIYAGSRFRGTDSALLMEKVVAGPRRGASPTPGTDSATGGWCWPAGVAAGRCRCSTNSRPSTRP